MFITFWGIFKMIPFKILTFTAMVVVAPIAAAPNNTMRSYTEASLNGCGISTERLYPHTLPSNEMDLQTEPEMIESLRRDFMGQCLNRHLS